MTALALKSLTTMLPLRVVARNSDAISRFVVNEVTKEWAPVRGSILRTVPQQRPPLRVVAKRFPCESNAKPAMPRIPVATNLTVSETGSSASISEKFG